MKRHPSCSRVLIHPSSNSVPNPLFITLLGKICRVRMARSVHINWQSHLVQRVFVFSGDKPAQAFSPSESPYAGLKAAQAIRAKAALLREGRARPYG